MIRKPLGTPTRVTLGDVCHPTSVSLTPQAFHWRWGHSDLLPGQPIIEYDYVLPEENPIHAGIATYAHRDNLDRFDMHDALECGFVLEGSVIRYWGSTRQKRLCGPGSVWFCPSYEPNGYRLVDTPCRVAVFEIRPQFVSSLHFAQAPHLDWLQPFTAPWQQRPRRVRDTAALMALGERLNQLLCKRSPLRRLHVQGIVTEFLTQVMESQKSGDRSPLRNRELHDRLQPAVELALRSQRRVTNREGAQACGMTVDQFMRAFHAVMGASFIRFGLRHRLQGAANELATSRRPLKAIAPDWGFADESHLSHVFVKHLNCTPSEYRERARA
ncbi:MAG: helix-turn-helix transcriptional regulator [Lentisphaerae bacterium]|nr:helix-turn-helix transcriptional regulator [Lentisphaerota bacterium]